MNITHRDLLLLARRFSISEKAVSRFVGSATVELKRELSQQEIDAMTSDPAAVASGGERFELGMRLGRDNSMKGETQKNIEEVGVALGEYRTLCPLVFAWIQAGDFDPKRIPDRMTRGVLVHASRTAGRLRARLMRS